MKFIFNIDTVHPEDDMMVIDTHVLTCEENIDDMVRVTCGDEDVDDGFRLPSLLDLMLTQPEFLPCNLRGADTAQ
jgi:hypothetical protein